EAHALQALQQSTPIGRGPGLEQSRGNGENRTLGCAEEELRREQHAKERLALEEERCDRGRHAGGKADEPDEDEHPARPETLADHPARELHRGVTDEERGLEPADMHLSETEIRNHPVAGHRDAYRLARRSEEHTSELQSRGHLVCRLLLEKKKKKTIRYTAIGNEQHME